MQFTLVLWLLWVPVEVLAKPVDEVMHVRYPEYVGDDPVFTRLVGYCVELLDLAMSKSGRAYQLVPVPGNAVTDRRAARLLDGGSYDVNWMNTNPYRESSLHAVYFPLFKGLAGWRLLLVKADSADAFVEDFVESDLKKMRVGLGRDWPDVDYMQSNGYSVVTSINRDSLVNMLLADRVDYLSRSVIEIWDELTFYDDRPLAIACCVALHYPAAFYFFTSRNNPELAASILKGLNQAAKDGSYQELFTRYYGEVIKKAELDKRRVFKLESPVLSDKAPLERTELWYHP
ncbi:transporter substrate-binding domain-containing protein [Gilvimarinus sp. SDUM040013]|uniref:Transporter substrate-binding domain-containing protein n=1 Tax=Gilvimarinus gilvus TaxID=3058038 RepID=A0ABU4RXQ5_9GAMM|nr:transporter substrate-binding domain-containing protein [Gilvimarinus sp. SDUM040013]MDO3387268.1 transporter substrate-binding domain-containing protein [Gilvimarinus sp. SDUM040013]MDX6848957.1 transporter substrate-binding domain-containing protein [Gilvimarinus sp. SDUM040013]